jgi:hypothetical protein
MSAMDHVRYLAETIGPRGSTRGSEKQAAQYAADTLQTAGLESITETFISARSGWHQYTLYAGVLLAGELLFWFGGQLGAVLAIVLTVSSLASVLVELTFRPNPLRWLLPKGSSQNVWARIEPVKEQRDQVVLIGHLDTHRTPLAFSTDGWLKLFGFLVPIGLVSSVALLIIFAGSLLADGGLWRPLSLPFALFVMGLLLITAQADMTDYTVGANDNATGAGIVLSLAERLSREPLEHTRVWAALTGCEEVACYGADAFARAHQGELSGTAWITLDTLGSRESRPCYLKQETFLLTAKSDPGLIAMADQVASQHPELKARAHDGFSGAYTEGSIGAKYGYRVLTLIALNDEGKPTEWHRPTDVVEKMDPAVVTACERFTWELLEEIDHRAG